MESKEKQELIRIAYYEGELMIDPTGKAKGRGVYLCKQDNQCFEKAHKRRAIQRNFGMDIPLEKIDKVFEELKHE